MVIINEVKIAAGRPCTLSLRGIYGHSTFIGELAGACFEIITTNPLSEEKTDILKEELKTIFPLKSHKGFQKKEIQKIMEKNNGEILINI